MTRKIVSMLIKGKMVPYNSAALPDRPNFVICCDHGDWSGFRTLPECEKQYAELESRNRPDGYFWVEER